MRLLDFFIDVTLRSSRAEAGIDRIERSAMNAGAQLGAMAFGAFGVAKALASTITAGASFEAQMNSVAALTSGTTEEMAALKDKARELGRTTKFSATEAAAGIESLARNGLTVKQILDGALDSTLLLAAAMGEDLAPTADFMTDVMGQFKIAAEDTGAVVDLLAGAAKSSKFDMTQLWQAFAQGGGTAAEMGVELQEFLATISLISPSFKSGSDAGTSFKTLMTRLPGITKPARKQLEKLGMEFFDQRGKLKDMPEIITQLRKGLGNLTDKSQIEAVQDIFGVDAMRVALALAGAEAGDYERILERIEEASAKEMANKRMEGLTGAWKELMSAVEAVQIALFESGIGAYLEGLVDKTAELVRGVEAWVSANPEVIEQMIEVVNTFAPIIGALIAARALVWMLAGRFRGLFFIASYLAARMEGISAYVKQITDAVNEWTAAHPELVANVVQILDKLAPILGMIFAARIGVGMVARVFGWLAAGVGLISSRFKVLLLIVAFLATTLLGTGESLAGVNEGLAETSGWIGKIVSAVQDWAAEHPELVNAVKTVFGALLPILSVMLAARMGIGLLMGAFRLLGVTALARAVASIAGWTKFSAIGGIITAVAGAFTKLANAAVTQAGRAIAAWTEVGDSADPERRGRRGRGRGRGLGKKALAGGAALAVAGFVGATLMESSERREDTFQELPEIAHLQIGTVEAAYMRDNPDLIPDLLKQYEKDGAYIKDHPNTRTPAFLERERARSAELNFPSIATEQVVVDAPPSIDPVEVAGSGHTGGKEGVVAEPDKFDALLDLLLAGAVPPAAMRWGEDSAAVPPRDTIGKGAAPAPVTPAGKTVNLDASVNGTTVRIEVPSEATADDLMREIGDYLDSVNRGAALQGAE